LNRKNFEQLFVYKAIDYTFEESNDFMMLKHSSNFELKRTFQSNKRLWPYLGSYFLMIDSVETLSFISLPIQAIGPGETSCLSFSYFTSTYYSKVNVYIKKDNLTNQLVWTSNNPSKYATNIGSNWKTDFVDIKNYDNFETFKSYEIKFEFVRGPKPIEEIAIDDIQIEKSMCISKKYQIFSYLINFKVFLFDCLTLKITFKPEEHRN
jgi:hypothetical protein